MRRTPEEVTVGYIEGAHFMVISGRSVDQSVVIDRPTSVTTDHPSNSRVRIGVSPAVSIVLLRYAYTLLKVVVATFH
jgi:hypothetical protein